MAVAETAFIPSDVVSWLVRDTCLQALSSIRTKRRGNDCICTLQMTTMLPGPLLVSFPVEMAPGKEVVVSSCIL